MSKRLVKIAKELNVGTGSIVDFLSDKGFDIDNRPTAKVSDEMYLMLVQEFQGSIAVKEQADQLIIGTNRQSKQEEEEVAQSKPAEASPSSTPEEEKSSKTSSVEETTKEKEEKEKEEKGKVEKKKEEEKPVEDDEGKKEEEKAEEIEKPAAEEKEKKEDNGTEVKPGLKVVGKIDLSGQKKPKKKKEDSGKAEVSDKEEKAEKKEEVKETTVKKAPEKEKTVDKKETKPEEAPAKSSSEKVTSGSKKEVREESKGEDDADETIKAEAPQLKGLKILGKISTDKFERPKKSKKDNKKKDTRSKKKSTDDSDSEDGAKKRKRRRRTKVVASNVKSGNNRGQGKSRRPVKGKKQQDEQKEVTHKEIEDQIKATMARLNKGGKNKRQKIRRDKRENIREKEEKKQLQEEDGKLEVTEFISVQELANLMDVSATEVITTCMNMGVIVSINQRLDAEIIELVAEEYGHEITFVDAEEKIDIEDEFEDDPEDLEDRSPIVTVMGHVDHGKTSLLDYIREQNVAGGEAGGITQHIGAYEVEVGSENKKITFLDTPGHEAFTAMRARGAKITDVAVVIVAADDEIMPQTKEAISHAQAAGVPIVFAINKIDKPGADPERIKQGLASLNFLVEDWGGKYQSQEISAKHGTNIDLLLEKILLESELLELKANPNRPAYGTVVEASLDKGRGYVAKLLVQNGTLKIGDPTVAGEHSGKVKAMFNEFGKRVKEAGPSQPVLVLGLSGAPQAGEKFKVLESEQETKQLAAKRAQIIREQTNRASKRISLDEIGRRLALGSFKELNLIVKGDVDGSVEALADSLIKLSVESIQVNVIHKGVGQIIESDVLLATASDAIIIGFQVRPSLGARKLAEQEGVEIKTYSIIYNAIEEIKMAMEGMLEPTKEENITAQLEVRETFKVSRIGTVAGCFVMEGNINRNNYVRVVRDGIVVYPSKEGQVAEISSLKRYKEDVRDVKSGMECGVTIKNYNDIKVGDHIEAYEVVEVKQTL